MKRVVLLIPALTSRDVVCKAHITAPIFHLTRLFALNIYEERCTMLDRLIGSFGVSNAIFILAINDVLYRYGVGWSAPYSESDIQAQDIAMKLIEQKPENAKAVKAVVQAVYDFWFNEVSA